MKKQKVTIDVLMEGHGGELIFQPVEFHRKELEQFARKQGNPVIRHNLEKEAKAKKVRL